MHQASDTSGHSKISAFLSKGIAPEIQNYLMAPTLLRSFSAVLPLISQINKAHVLMLARREIISPEAAQKLAQVILQLEQEGESAFELNPELEEAYFNYEAEVIKRAGSDVGGRMHTARSRNDLKSAQDRLLARGLALRILNDLLVLREKTVERADELKDVVMPGYTHMQPAQPITFGYYLLGIAHALERDQERISQCYARINLSPMGACALAGTTFPIDRGMTAELLGFDGVIKHAQDAVASRDSIIELLSHCTLLASTLGRMAQDFYFMSTYEFQTVDFPDSVATTSSIMPQKKNMGVLENLKGRVAQLLGATVTAVTALKATPFTHTQEVYNDALRWAWEALEEITRMLPVSRLVVETVNPNRERMMELVRGNFSTATDLADMLVKEAGLPFREAHHVVGYAVRLALNSGLKADEMTTKLVQTAASEVLGRELALEEKTVQDCLDPRRAAEQRAGSGGPASTDIAAMIASLKTVTAQDRQKLNERSERVAGAGRRLDTAFQALGRGQL